MCQPNDQAEQRACIVGLGNPGEGYAPTRHNVGFMVVDRLARKYGIGLQPSRFRADWGYGRIEGCEVLLFKPLTFMNRSGEAVAELLREIGVAADRLLVLHDDLDLPLGRLRLVRQGGAGGHRGVRSLIEQLQCQELPRLKLGIGRPERGEDVEAYVLAAPYPEQRESWELLLVRACEAVELVLSAGLATAMDRFNRRSPVE